VQRLDDMDPALVAPALQRYQDRLAADFTRTLHRLQGSLRPKPIALEDVPPAIAQRFVGRDGRLLLQIEPKVDVWDRAGAERFVRELRTVDPEVTGTPIISFEAIRYMERAYKQGTLYALLLVGVLTAVSVARGREATLAMVSLLLGTLWTVGLMVACRLPFNLGNVFGFPLVLGAGAEFGINVVLRNLEDRRRGGSLVPRSTFLAVLCNGLTTVVGFGSLMTAAHRGIFGLGLLLTLGMVATLSASLVVLPVMLRWTEVTAIESRDRVAWPRRAYGSAASFALIFATRASYDSLRIVLSNWARKLAARLTPSTTTSEIFQEPAAEVSWYSTGSSSSLLRRSVVPTTACSPSNDSEPYFAVLSPRNRSTRRS